MPLVTNAVTNVVSTINYTFSNCQSTIIGQNVIVHNVTLSALNASGFLCSIWVAYPWFWVGFLISLYIILFFLFSYLNSIKLIVVANSGLFIMATILLGYGFIGGTVWLGTLAMLLFAVIIMYLGHRG